MTPGPPRRARRALFTAVMLLLPLGVAELASRLVWTLGHHLPPLSPLVYVYYPELRPVREADPGRADAATFDVLLLGASVLERPWGDVGGRLGRELEAATGRRVRVHNVSRRAHTSLDSFYKYRHLRDRGFDLVVVYHGINDLRANLCPPEVFRDDYSHFSWYDTLDAFESHPETRWVTLPWSLHDLWLELGKRLWPRPRVPRRIEDVPGWLRYGANVKSAGPFRRNIEGILDLAAARHEPVLLMSFASYVAPGYSRRRFEAGRLDYAVTRKAFPIELWGRPVDVVNGLAVHNRVVRELAAGRGTLFVDQDALVPKNGRNFRDLCHFTDAGASVFAANVAGALARSRR